MDDRSDEHLLACFQGGDAGAFEELVRRHQTPLLRHARAVLGSRAEAEDVVQDTLMKLVKSPPVLTDARASAGPLGHPEPASPSGLSVGAWLHKVTRNACMDELRSSARRREREAERAPAERDGRGLECCEHGDVRAAVERGITQLPEDQREVLVLRLLGERSYKDIAGITGRKIGTVGWLVSEGLTRLADELGPLLGMEGVARGGIAGPVGGAAEGGRGKSLGVNAGAIDGRLTENTQ